MTAHAITESSATFPGTLQMPSNGDDADAAFLEILLKALGDRTQWLKALCTVGGVPRLATVATIADLKAVDVSTVDTNDLRLIEGAGIYQYDNGSMATELAPWIIQPTAGAGRWIHMLSSYAPTNRMIDPVSVYGIFDYSNATTGYTTVIGMSHTGAVAGDIMLIDWSAAFTGVGGGGSYSRLTITDGGIDTDIAPTRNLHSAAREQHGGSFKHVVGTTGTVSVTLKAASISSGTTTTDCGSTATLFPTLRSLLHRP